MRSSKPATHPTQPTHPPAHQPTTQQTTIPSNQPTTPPEQIFIDASSAIAAGRPPNSRACKYALNCLMNIFSSPGLPDGVGQATLHRWVVAPAPLHLGARAATQLGLHPTGPLSLPFDQPSNNQPTNRPTDHPPDQPFQPTNQPHQAGACPPPAAGGRAPGQGARGRGAAQGWWGGPPFGRLLGQSPVV